MSDESCDKCKGDPSSIACINGSLYGFCLSEYCYGACEYIKECDCECHKEPFK